MKRIIFLLVTFLPLLVFGQKAKIDFPETSYNFGEVREANGRVSHEFKFKNTGKAPLILTNVRAGCGCTTPEWSRQPIAPGAESNIKVTFDPRNRPGKFVKSVTVNSNAENSVVSLTIRGDVAHKPATPYSEYVYSIGELKLSGSTINIGSVKNTQKITKTLDIVNPGTTPIHINISTDAPHLAIGVNPSTLQKGQKGKIEVVYDASKKNDWGFVTDKIAIKVNDKTQGEIAVVATINEDFSAYEGKFEQAPLVVFPEKEASLENLAKNSSHTHDFYIQNNGKSDLIIRKVKTSDTKTSVHLAKTTIKPGKKVKATVTFATDEAPKTVKIIAFTTNDPQHTQINYKLTAQTK